MMNVTALEEKKITWDEFREMELDEQDIFIYELFNGTILKRSAPSLSHQRTSRKLLRFIDNYLEETQLGEVFSAPIDMSLDEFNGFQPDLAYISKERSFILADDDYIKGAPDILIEIISPGNVKRDRVDKKNLCEKFAIREFWLVDPLNKTIEIYVMQGNSYVLHGFYENEGTLKSTVLPGLEMDCKTVFGKEVGE